MPAMFWGDQQHVLVFRNLAVGERREWNERIAFGVNDQRRNSNPLDERKRARFRVIIPRSVEAVVMLKRLVPIPQTSNAADPAKVINARKEAVFLDHRFAQA